MSTIRVTRAHPFSVEEAKQKLEPLRHKMQKQLGLTTQWDENNLVFKGTGANGVVVLSEDDVDVTINLGLLFTPLKSKLEEKIAKGLDEVISNHSA